MGKWGPCSQVAQGLNMCIPENEQLIAYWNSEKEWNSSVQEEINSFRDWRGGRIFLSPTKIRRKKMCEYTGSIFFSLSLKKYKALKQAVHDGKY